MEEGGRDGGGEVEGCGECSVVVESKWWSWSREAVEVDG